MSAPVPGCDYCDGLGAIRSVDDEGMAMLMCVECLWVFDSFE